MLQKLLRFSLNNSGLVVLLALAALMFSVYILPQMPVDVFPTLNAPRVLIMTEAGGYSAEEVEQYITFPIESSVNGLPDVKKVRSASSGSLSLVWVDFNWGADLYRARQLVSERLAIAEKTLPEDVHAEIAPITSITGEIMLISLRSDDDQIGDLDLRALGEFDLRNRLLSISGIAQVVAIGGELPEYQINVQEERLRLYHLTLQEVVEAVERAHSTASAGYLPNSQGLEITLQQIARIRNAGDIRNTIIRYQDNVPLTIGEVAEVKLGPALSRGTASDMGRQAVVLSIQKAPGTNTLALTREVDRVLDGFEAALPKGISLNRHAFRQSDFINLSIDNVVAILRDASLLVVIVLVLFLMNVRTTIITLTALPLSLAVALLAMRAFGLNINVMTLGGLAVAIGELVDDAIIDVENCYRRLMENARLPEAERRPTLRVVYESSNEIRSSVVFATVIIAVVFVPLIFLQGLEGRFFRPLGLAYIIAIMSSLLVALTLTPVMNKYLLRGKVRFNEKTGGDSLLVRLMKRLYAPALRFSLRFRHLVMAVAMGLVGLSIWFAASFGTSFLPRFQEGTFTVFLLTPPGTSLVESDRIAQGVERQLAKIPGVVSVVRRSGRAEKDEHAEPVSTSEIDICIDPSYRQMDIKTDVQKVLDGLPGITTMIGQPIEHRLSHVLSGTKADIAINIYGHNLDRLRAAAKEVAAYLRQIPGAADVSANRDVLIDTIGIHYRSPDLAAFGITREDAAEQVSVAFNGKVVDTVNQGIRRYDVVVRLSEQERRDISDVRNFVLHTPAGKQVTLSEVADVRPEESFYLVARHNAKRKATVSCNVADGYNMGHLIREVRATITQVVQKNGLSVSFGGQFEAQQSASVMLTVMGVAVVVAILFLLDMATGSFRTALLVMVNLPLAIIGGVIAIYISESPDVVQNTLALVGLSSARFQAPVISVSSIVGYITLFGIAIRNGLLLVNRYSRLVVEDDLPLHDAIFKGSLDRLVPIMMTALVTLLGLVPLVLGANKPGSELLAPLAIVGLGGLTSSTLLNLFVIPAGYALIYTGRSLRKEDKERIAD